MLEKNIAEIVVSHGKLPHAAADLRPDADLFDLGMSSYNAVQIMMALEERYDIRFPDELLRKEHFATLGRLASAVRSLLD